MTKPGASEFAAAGQRYLEILDEQEKMDAARPWPEAIQKPMQARWDLLEGEKATLARLIDGNLAE